MPAARLSHKSIETYFFHQLIYKIKCSSNQNLIIKLINNINVSSLCIQNRYITNENKRKRSDSSKNGYMLSECE